MGRSIYFTEREIDARIEAVKGYMSKMEDPVNEDIKILKEQLKMVFHLQ